MIPRAVAKLDFALSLIATFQRETFPLQSLLTI
jgi:hypothetical protein